MKQTLIKNGVKYKLTSVEYLTFASHRWLYKDSIIYIHFIATKSGTCNMFKTINGIDYGYGELMQSIENIDINCVCGL